MDCIRLAEQWRAFVDTVTNIWGPLVSEEFSE
jgi:hypothetical protein